MDIGSLFLILALFILVLLFIGRPFFEHKLSAAVVNEPPPALSALLAERDRALSAIHDLDSDHSLGKVSEEDYLGQRAELIQHGVDILRKLDELQPQTVTVQAEEPEEDRFEEAIASRRAARVVAAPRPNGHGAAPDDQIEVLIANRRRSRSEKSAGFCHKCGSPLQISDHFCPRCGARIPER